MLDLKIFKPSLQILLIYHITLLNNKLKQQNKLILFTYIFFLTPFLPPFERPLFLPTAMITELAEEK